MTHLSKQQRKILAYLSRGGWHSTVEIIRHFLDTEGYVLFDLRKRISELKAKGLVETRQIGKYADYKLTVEVPVVPNPAFTQTFNEENLSLNLPL